MGRCKKDVWSQVKIASYFWGSLWQSKKHTLISIKTKFCLFYRKCWYASTCSVPASHMPAHGTHCLPGSKSWFQDAERNCWDSLFLFVAWQHYSFQENTHLTDDTTSECTLTGQHVLCCKSVWSLPRDPGLNEMRTLEAAFDLCECLPQELSRSAGERVAWGCTASITLLLSRDYCWCS